jgi:single-strand DNA-binding protein
MTGINKVILLGNATRQAELRTTGGGMSVCNFGLAVNEQLGKDKATGQAREKVQFFQVTTFGKLAEICGTYVTKGKQVFVEGRIEFREDDRDGVKKIYTNIIANEVKLLGGGDRQQQGSSQRGAPVDDGFGTPPAPFPVDDSDMPF